MSRNLKINSEEDREKVYKDWTRSINVNGFFMDLDSILWSKVNNRLFARAITELTRTDQETVSQAYLDAITKRYSTSAQGQMIKMMSQLLNCPAYIVLYPKSMAWLKVYSFRKQVWRNFTLEQWEQFLREV